MKDRQVRERARRSGVDGTINADQLGAAARKRGLALEILDVDRPASTTPDGDSLVLSRPDQHVAWRSNRLPGDCLALIDRVRGAASQAQ